MRKRDFISMLVKETVKNIVRGEDSWRKYLNTASRIYKYPFWEQLCIYAQRPDAEACASIEVWNGAMHCWVNRGAKGIALLDEEMFTGLRYVFDISDVHRSGRRGQFPYLWEMKEEHEEAVIKRLEEIYGGTAKDSGFIDRIREIAGRVAGDNYGQTAADMEYLCTGSYLEEYDELNFNMRIGETLADSIAYMVLKRCGVEEAELAEAVSFPYIYEFNTLGTVCGLGDSVSGLAKDILMEIGKVIRAFDREQEKNRAAQKSFAKIQNKLESIHTNDYNTLKRESEGLKTEEEEKEAQNGTEIREKRGLPDSGTAGGRTAGRGAEEIRPDAEKLSEGAQERDLYGAPSGREAERASSDGAGAGGREDGSIDRADEGAEGDRRTVQGREPDALGTEDERNQAVGGRDSFGRTDIQLNKGERKPEDTLSSGFSSGSFSQDGAGADFRQGKPSLRKKQKEEYVQLSLFPGMEGQMGTAALSGAANFRIVQKGEAGTENKLSRREKFRRNVEAVRLLKKIEAENRNAVPSEQEVLSEYAGWGGLADAFDEGRAEWKAEYQELKGLLTEEEYAQARASTLNAYYTPPAVVQTVYEVLGQAGFAGGKILEPSMGTGRFFGMLPEKMQGSRLYGVELDSLTGRIAKQLYPDADIQIAGFEETSYPDDFFDAAVGNVPFGGYKTADRQYDKYNFLIHDYFIAKAIDKVKRGGIAALVTTNGMGGGTFDKKDDRARRYFAERCDLLGAIRLPERTFEDTDVATDILFFRKRERQRDLSAELPEWVETTVVFEGDYVRKNGEKERIRLSVNNYFLHHPEMVLGKLEAASGPFGPQMKCLPESGSLEEKLGKAAANIRGRMEAAGLEEYGEEADRPEKYETEASRPEKYEAEADRPEKYEAEADRLEEYEEEADEGFLPARQGVKNYSYALIEDRVYYREDSVMKPVKVSETAERRIRGMLSIRDCAQELIAAQLEDSSDILIKEKQEELNRLYDGYTEEFGRINDRANRLAFGEDSGYYLLCSLEKLDEDGKFEGKADIFTKRTIKRRTVITSVDTAGEALAVSLNEKGRIDLAYMSALTGRDEAGITGELSGVVFRNPVTENWETADEYLSGNVRKKLETARVFAGEHPEYAVNVEALERVQPKELEASEIEVALGATWIGPEYIRDFMREIFELPEYYFERKMADVLYIKATGQWVVKGKSINANNALIKTTYGTDRANGYRILEDSLNLRNTRIYDVVTVNGEEKRVLNRTETMLAGQKQEVMRETFKEWIFGEPERRRTLCAKYNRLFNAVRPREYDGAHLTFPYMSPEYHLEPYQANAVAHQIYGNNTLLAHCVGAGKSATRS